MNSHLAHSQISSKSAETLDMLIAHYVSGGLPAPIRVLVDGHVEINPKSRILLSGLESMAGQEIERCAPAGSHDLDGMFDRIVNSAAPAETPGKKSASCSVLPAALRDLTGCSVDEIPWKTKMPGFRVHNLGEMDGCEAELYWIRPGRAIPAHSHQGTELTLVLQGGFADMEGHYIRGDVAAADESVDHRPVADPDAPCICFAVTTAPLKLTGSLGQLFSDIFGR